MPRNGSGVYTAPVSSFNPATAGQSALPADFNALLSDLSTAVSNSIAADGQTTITNDLPLANHKFTGAANATARDQFGIVGQLQDTGYVYAADTGAADVYAIAPTPAITAYAVGQVFRFLAAHANATTTPTLAVSGLLAGTIKYANAGALAAGDLPLSGIVLVACAAVAVGVPTWNLLSVTTRPAPAFDVTLLMPTGVVLPYAGSSAPSGYTLCFGQAVSRTTFAALFAVIGTTYGAGDGSTTFNLPDLRGRVVAGADAMGGSAANRLGSGVTGGITGAATVAATGGEQSHQLTVAELAGHTHTVTNGNIAAVAQSGGVSAIPAGPLASGSTGGDTAHNNTQPTLVLNYIIRN